MVTIDVFEVRLLYLTRIYRVLGKAMSRLGEPPLNNRSAYGAPQEEAAYDTKKCVCFRYNIMQSGDPQLRGSVV